MAEKYFPFSSVSGDRRYSAEDWAAYFALFLSDGVCYSSADRLKVVVNEGMKVKVINGAGFIAGRMYILETDKILTLDTANGALNRIDRIVLRCDYTNRKMEVAAVKGEYSKTPTAPALTRNADVYELALADVYVAAGVIEITTANITDQRLNTSLCGIVTGLIEQADTTEIFNQFNAYFETFKQTSAEDFNEAINEWDEEFNAWFDNIRDALEGVDIATEVTERLTKLEDGTTPAGDSNKLGGKGASEYALQSAVDAIQTTSVGKINTGWYRVAEYNASESQMRGTFANTCEILLQRTSFTYNSHCKLVLDSVTDIQKFYVVDANARTQVYTKVRYVKDPTNLKAYIEVYCSDSDVNTIVTINAPRVSGYPYWKAITPVLTAEIVEGVTVTTTYNIPMNAKPVTDLDLDTYSYPAIQISSDTELTNKLVALHESVADCDVYCRRLGFSYQHSIFGGGSAILRGFRQSSTHGHCIIEKRRNSKFAVVASCSFDNGTWGEWSVFATTADLASYLLKTGGTVEDTTGTRSPNAPLSIRTYRNNETYPELSLIGYLNAIGETLGFLGFNGINIPVFRTTTGHNRTLIHEGNVGSYALPRTGGQLTGSLTVSKDNNVNVVLNQIGLKRDGSKPSETKYSNLITTDADGKTVGVFQNGVSTTGNVRTRMSAYRNAENTEYASIGIRADLDGNFLPYYSVGGGTEHELMHSGNSNKIVFTEDGSEAPAADALWAHL